jgi:NAD(P)H-hydrate epimerase
LKGHRTLVATPEGTVYINPTGNPGMATGGSGDVLTGMVAGWLAQGLGVTAACLLAVYLHGAAGDLAAADLGEAAMTAGDIVARIGAATLALASDTPEAHRGS